jgi:uncharacterized membrane protein
MKNFRNAAFLVFLLALLANAQEKTQDHQKNLRSVVYLHPLPLFFGMACDMFMFNSTFEIPLNLSNSVVIQPAIWLGSSDEEILGIEYEKLIRVGSGIGLRRYAVDKGYGFYLQIVAGAYYISAEKINDWEKVKGAVGELMLYAGSAHKWQNVSFFYEFGMGFGYDGTETQQMGYINRLATSFNLGVGIPF